MKRFTNLRVILWTLLTVVDGLAWYTDSESDHVGSSKFLVGLYVAVGSKTRTKTKPDQPQNIPRGGGKRMMITIDPNS